MKNYSKRICVFLLLFVVMALISIIPATAAVISTPQTYTTSEDSILIEAKYKKISINKITFNANGGKIGTEKIVTINIQKGTKIKKFPATPKRAGYDFKGWYTKKTGGKKIAVSTKPTKSMTYFAQWIKRSSNVNSKIVGSWVYNGYKSKRTSSGVSLVGVIKTYYFRKNGSFLFTESYREYVYTGPTCIQGKYKITNGKIYFTNIVYDLGTRHEERLNDRVHES